ncbi:MAG TPA: DUF2269 family protein [Thermoleophilaceae bacterium]|nr:DUF2269 family protein [Thermoleophilaceae bacterium]
MSRYDAYKFVHVTAAIVWLGAGVMIQILGARAMRARDDEFVGRLFGEAGSLGKVLFIPASLTVVAFGILMVVDGPWDFEPLWIVLGLAGYAATFVTGAFILGPRAEKAAARAEREGGISPSIAAEMRRVLVLGRIDTVVLFLVVAVMVTKPTGDDVGILAAMLAILVGGTGLTIAIARGAEAEATAAP